MFRRLAGISSQPSRVAYRSVAEPAGHLNPCFSSSSEQVEQSYRGHKKEGPQPEPTLPPYNPVAQASKSGREPKVFEWFRLFGSRSQVSPEVVGFPPRTRRVVEGARLVTREQFIVVVVLSEFPEPLSSVVESLESNQFSISEFPEPLSSVVEFLESKQFSISESQEPPSTRSVTIKSRVSRQ